MKAQTDSEIMLTAHIISVDDHACIKFILDNRGTTPLEIQEALFGTYRGGLQVVLTRSSDRHKLRTLAGSGDPIDLIRTIEPGHVYERVIPVPATRQELTDARALSDVILKWRYSLLFENHSKPLRYQGVLVIPKIDGPQHNL